MSKTKKLDMLDRIDRDEINFIPMEVVKKKYGL